MKITPVHELDETQYFHCIEYETKQGINEFSLIFDDENKRVEKVVDKENQRIMQEARTNGTIDICAICLEEIPPIQPHEANNRGRSGMMMICCDAKLCKECEDKSLDFIYGKCSAKCGTKCNPTCTAKCFNCREPIRTPKLWAENIKPNDRRHWLLGFVAAEYMKSTGGLKKNIKKAMKLYKRAADLGNTIAQDEMAYFYFNGCGDSDSFRCTEKAKYYAEKAADQGASNSQYILAEMLMNNVSVFNNNRDEEVLQLLTLAAFQGHQQALKSLVSIYDKRLSKSKWSLVRGEAWRKNLLLRLYWYGKFAEVEKKNPEGCISLPYVALNLHRAMTLLWHPRDDGCDDTLPGHSHVPFCTWALAKGGQQKPCFIFDYWENRCANCHIESGKKNQFKACARCKAFHYCSKKCQAEHWKAGHKIDCKGHWIEEFFPDMRKTHE